MGRRRLAIAASLLAGCNWIVGIHDLPPSDARGDAQGIADGRGPGDASGDAAVSCTNGATRCTGRDLQTCAGDAWQSQTCDFTCAEEPEPTCVAASNMTSVAAACGSTDPSTWPVLDPGSGGTITYARSEVGALSLACTTGSGSACGTISSASVDLSNPPGVAWFCVQSFALEAGATLTGDGSAEPADALGLVVDGDVQIDGTIALDGSAPIVASPQPGKTYAGGLGGPGGFAGGSGDYLNAVGASGSGLDASGGDGGQGSGDRGPVRISSGGGGGGGNSTAGGTGGSAMATFDEAGGAGGLAAAVDWLVGGGGGGGTTSGPMFGIGYPGAGGGGAIQISARGQIAIAGTISATGGSGYATLTGNNEVAGGTGGGAGGMILLEAPAVTATGTLVVDGGNGGAGYPSAPGGTGASGALQAQPGATASTGQSCGGGGGGGGAGRIAVHSASPSCPANGISPTYCCTAAALQGSAE